MKIQLVKSMATLMLLILWVFSSKGQSQVQTLPIGVMENNQAVITQTANAERLLKANLPQNVTISELKLEYSEYDRGYYLTARVGNNEISSVGILLHTNGTELEARIGPGVEITCSGYNCSDCRIAFSKYRPYCRCFRSTGTDSRCDMISKVTIGL